MEAAQHHCPSHPEWQTESNDLDGLQPQAAQAHQTGVTRILTPATSAMMCTLLEHSGCIATYLHFQLASAGPQNTQ